MESAETPYLRLIWSKRIGDWYTIVILTDGKSRTRNHAQVREMAWAVMMLDIIAVFELDRTSESVVISVSRM